ncbi:MAG: helicase-associated domain-containing protein [Deltaproteobacteria bacterium]|nr:helicase-associated domain-containing protein [Deltaproteobacteria bacterium]
MPNLENPLIVQADKSILLEVHNPRYEEARDALARFAELEKSPDHLHTYRITPLSLWNAASSGVNAETVQADLERLSKYPVPPNLLADVRESISRYGRIKLVKGGAADELELQVSDAPLGHLIQHTKDVAKLLIPGGGLRITADNRGEIKQALIKVGYPVVDEAGFTVGEPLEFSLRDTMLSGKKFDLRHYQSDSVGAFMASGGGNGVICLPCGAGKTVVALAAAAQLKTKTLVLATNITAVRQWMSEVLDKTTLTAEQVGEYSGDRKEVKPFTVATYQIITRRSGDKFPHLSLFNAANWGLIVYDEVHLLPAPIFRFTAGLQARRRLGLTATLIREDGREGDVFALIGPKRYDVPWREMERAGFIAEATCTELRLPLPEGVKMAYATSDARNRFNVAAQNPVKESAVKELLVRHKGESILVIGQYLEQLRSLSEGLKLPLITGETPQADRDVLFAKFRTGEVPVLVVSKIGNFSIDLPDASVLIQVSGTFGSRQEEAQRLGRVLRPKDKPASFYSLVSEDTVELDFAMKRQLFLTEQGYRYKIEDYHPVAKPLAATPPAQV